MLRWALQKQCVIVPKATSDSRLAENANLFHFALGTEQMAAIDALDRGHLGRTCWRNDPLRMLEFR